MSTNTPPALKFTETPKGVKAFICRCGPNAETAKVVMAEVRARLADGGEELRPSEVTGGNFVTCVVWSLEWDFHAHISRIYCDQWACVTADDRDGFHVSVQCDEVEDGFAGVWKAFADRSQRRCDAASQESMSSSSTSSPAATGKGS